MKQTHEVRVENFELLFSLLTPVGHNSRIFGFVVVCRGRSMKCLDDCQTGVYKPLTRPATRQLSDEKCAIMQNNSSFEQQSLK